MPTHISAPFTFEETCQSGNLAVLIYDMQRGIFTQAPALQSVVPNVLALLTAARAHQIPTFFSRHTSLPKALLGTGQLRTAMVWQHTRDIQSITSRFLPGSPAAELLPELQPQPSEVTFDKTAMSFFTGTPLDTSLRDLGVKTIIIAGVVLEIGILPTILQALDLGYVPIVVTDACGSVDAAIRKQIVTYLAYMGTVLLADTKAIVAALDAR